MDQRIELLILMIALLLTIPKPLHSDTTIDLHICINDSCIPYFFNSSKCLFYNINHPLLLRNLLESKTLIAMDYRNYDGFGIPIYSRGLMHEKYCLRNNTLIVTSYNPAISSYDQLNVLAIINDSDVSRVFDKHFQEVLQERLITTTFSKGNITICFSPSNECRYLLLKELSKARKEIDLYLYVLTDPLVIDLLNSKNVTIHGFIYGKNPLRRKVKITNKFLHTKLFIIDNETIIMGSYNPSRNAYLNNYEDLLIIHSSQAIFLRENLNSLLSITTLSDNSSASSND